MPRAHEPERPQPALLPDRPRERHGEPTGRRRGTGRGRSRSTDHPDALQRAPRAAPLDGSQFRGARRVDASRRQAGRPTKVERTTASSLGTRSAPRSRSASTRRRGSQTVSPGCRRPCSYRGDERHRVAGTSATFAQSLWVRTSFRASSRAVDSAYSSRAQASARALPRRCPRNAQAVAGRRLERFLSALRDSGPQ